MEKKPETFEDVEKCFGIGRTQPSRLLTAEMLQAKVAEDRKFCFYCPFFLPCRSQAQLNLLAGVVQFLNQVQLQAQGQLFNQVLPPNLRGQ